METFLGSLQVPKQLHLTPPQSDQLDAHMTYVWRLGAGGAHVFE